MPCVQQRNGFHCRGVGAMELVAMDMKLRGMYIARQLSFHGVTFRIEEIPLQPSFKKVYDESVELVRETMTVVSSLTLHSPVLIVMPL